MQVHWYQCDQIWRFIGLWASIKCFWHHLPKSLTFLWNFCEGIKIYHFLVKSFLGKFYRHLEIFFWSHWLVHQMKHFWFLNFKEISISFQKCFQTSTIGWIYVEDLAHTSLYKDFFKGAIPTFFFLLFLCLFQTNISIYATNNVKNDSSRM